VQKEEKTMQKMRLIFIGTIHDLIEIGCLAAFVVGVLMVAKAVGA
jgi:hypothetical protein